MTATTATTLRTEEVVGLGAAVLLHVGLAAILLFRPDPEALPPLPERVTVSIATDVGLEATSPEPVLESRAAIAPTLSDEPAPPAPDDPAIAAPAPAPAPAAASPAAPPAARRPPPRRNADRTAPRTPPAARQPPRRRPDNPASRVTPRNPPAKPPAPARRAGGSRVGADFLPGSGDSATTEETRAPARSFGPSERAALGSAIRRQLRPHWSGRAPQGLDAEKLVTVLTWELNPDGSLKGTPRVLRQSGVTDANRAQADRHAEVAIRAVQLAAPFELPDEFYDRWKLIRDWQFDRRL